jgi:hypothetical protein
MGSNLDHPDENPLVGGAGVRTLKDSFFQILSTKCKHDYWFLNTSTLATVTNVYR